MATNEESKKNRFPIFQERLNKLRGEMNQEAFARKIGISRPTVGFYENGERLPDALVLMKIADVCGVSVDWLLGRTNDESGDADVGAVEQRLGLSPDAQKALIGRKRDIDRDKERTPRSGYNGLDFIIWLLETCNRLDSINFEAEIINRLNRYIDNWKHLNSLKKVHPDKADLFSLILLHDTHPDYKIQREYHDTAKEIDLQYFYLQKNFEKFIHEYAKNKIEEADDNG